MRLGRLGRLLGRGLGGLAVSAVAVVVTGRMLPATHTAVLVRQLPAPPSVVWPLIRDIEASARWRPTVREIVVVEQRSGREVFEERGDLGPVRYVVESESAPSVLVTRIVDNRDFGGTWTHQLEDAPGGSRLSITEDGVIHNPLFRFFARFVFGYRATLEGYADALEAELAARIADG